MKKINTVPAAAAALLLAGGCFSSGKSIVTEYDPATGKVTKTTENSIGVVQSITASTKEKLLFFYDNSFLAYLNVTTSSTDTPVPAMKIGIGKADRGFMSVPIQAADAEKLSGLVKQARAGEVNITSSGVASKSE